jgi:hypothetical protein
MEARRVRPMRFRRARVVPRRRRRVRRLLVLGGIGAALTGYREQRLRANERAAAGNPGNLSGE